MALFHAAALADEASEAAGENKETMWDLILNGGLIMIPLALASLLALALGLERFIMLNKERILPATFVDGLDNSIDNPIHVNPNAVARMAGLVDEQVIDKELPGRSNL